MRRAVCQRKLGFLFAYIGTAAVRQKHLGGPDCGSQVAVSVSLRYINLTPPVVSLMQLTRILS